MAHTAKEAGHQVFLLFFEDLFFSNEESIHFRMYDFISELEDNSCYIKHFSLEREEYVELFEEDTIHMRLDPPFNLKYLQTLWLLNGLQERGIRITNSSRGILSYNEKIMAYSRDLGITSWVGSDVDHAKDFIQRMLDDGQSSFIFKPLDLFQGLGVEKIEFLDSTEQEVESFFLGKAEEFNGPVVIQPFMSEVETGEIRTVFYRGAELGSILKVPPKGEFLANIAQGATYDKTELSEDVFYKCEKIAIELNNQGVELVAFDVLAGAISEVNITCPGLLVELSQAYQENLTRGFFS